MNKVKVSSSPPPGSGPAEDLCDRRDGELEGESEFQYSWLPAGAGQPPPLAEGGHGEGGGEGAAEIPQVSSGHVI